jgi:hypothetical protein
MKIYEDATDKEIIDFMASKGFNIPKQTLCNMWRNPFYAGISKNKLLGDQEIKGNWEPLVSMTIGNYSKKSSQDPSWPVYQSYQVNWTLL